MPTSTLTISTYNSPAALELCLASVRAQRVPPTEVIVADDGSGEPTAAIVRQFQANFPVPLHHVWHEDRGFRLAEIRNKAIAAARGEYIIQIDGDLILHRSFVADHLRFARRGFFIKGARTLTTQEKAAALLARGSIDVSVFSNGLAKRANALRLPWLAPLLAVRRHKARDVIGCNMSFWRSDLLAVNGYNNELHGWGNEDVELAARLINAGVLKWQLRLAAVCFHLYHPENPRDRAEQNRRVYDAVVREKRVRCDNGLQACMS